MKKHSGITVIALAIVLLTIPILSTGCQTGESEPITNTEDSSTTEAPDDIVPAPGLGPQYRANIHQQGTPNPWPEIQVTETSIGTPTDVAQVTYRDYIETQAGQTRTNMFHTYLPGVDPSDSNLEAINVTLQVDKLPSGITVTQDDWEWHGPDPARQSKTALIIDISPQIWSADYIFDIEVEINGVIFGSVPCTIKVEEGIPEVLRYGDHGINSTKIELMPGENVTKSSGLMVRFTLDDLVEKSDAIIIGKVVDIYPARSGTETPWSSFLTIFTDVIIETERYLYGEPHSAYIAVRVTGGRVDDMVVWVEDEPIFNLGEEAILFLTRIPQPNIPPEGIISDNYYRVTGVSQGNLGYAGIDENTLPGVFVSVTTIEEKIAEVYGSN